MKLYFEIFQLSQDQAPGCIVIMQPGNTPEIVIPFSMPLRSYQAAVENYLLTTNGGDLVAESTLFLSPEEIRK